MPSTASCLHDFLPLPLSPPRLAPATQIQCVSRTSLVVQWLRFRTANAEDLGSMPDWKLRSHMPCSVCKKFKKKKRKQMLCVSESHSQMSLIRLPPVQPPCGLSSSSTPWSTSPDSPLWRRVKWPFVYIFLIALETRNRHMM